MTGNFEVIENHIKEYKDLTYLLNSLQEELDDVSKSLKTARKNTVSVRGKNDEVSLLNQKRVEL